MRRYACRRLITHPILDNGQVDPDVADPRFAMPYSEESGSSSSE
jgi:hypothetical protein